MTGDATGTARRGMIRLTPEILLEWLNLSREHGVEHIVRSSETIDVTIVGPDMPDCPEGAKPIVVTPLYRRRQWERIGMQHQGPEAPSPSSEVAA